MKLITWNVQWFCGLDGRVDVARVVQHARSMADFDVLCLQEVAVNYPRLRGDASQDQPAQMCALLPGFEVCFGAAVDERADDGSGRRRFGNVIASRLPVALAQHHALPWPPAPGLRSMPRMASVATVQAPWGPLRVMTTHLEYFSQAQRLAQTHELLRLHAQAAAQAAQPPLADDSGGPFQAKPHTADCILTADFNFDPASDEYRVITGDNGTAPRLHDAWRLVHGDAPQPPTFHVHDSTYSPVPVACDFIFASAGMAPRVRRVSVDSDTTVSDHQPVLLELA
jgi:endonuclease/exonuclease/phosphatase family metal-dependent hydrolase